MRFQKIFFNQPFYGFLPKEVIVHGQQKLVCVVNEKSGNLFYPDGWQT